MEGLISEVQKHHVLWNKLDKNYKNKRQVDVAWDAVARETGMSKEEAKNKWKNLRDTFMKELKKIEKPKSGDSGDSNAGMYTGKWMYFELMQFLTSTHLPRPTEGNFSPESLSISEVHRIEVIDSSQLQQSIVEEQIGLEDEVDEGNTSYRLILEQPLDEGGEGGISFTADDATPKPTSASQVRPPPKKRPRVQPLSAFEEHMLQVEQQKLGCLREPEDDDLSFFKSLVPFMKKLNDIQKLKVRNEFQSVLIRELSNDE